MRPLTEPDLKISLIRILEHIPYMFGINFLIHNIINKITININILFENHRIRQDREEIPVAIIKNNMGPVRMARDKTSFYFKNYIIKASVE